VVPPDVREPRFRGLLEGQNGIDDLVVFLVEVGHLFAAIWLLAAGDQRTLPFDEIGVLFEGHV